MVLILDINFLISLCTYFIDVKCETYFIDVKCENNLIFQSGYQNFSIDELDTFLI